MNTKQVQLALISLGYGQIMHPYGADGKIGAKTREAVKTFQNDYNKRFNKNILVDGKPGPQTYAALKEWQKQAGSKGTRNFKISEFRCKGSRTLPNGGIDPQLILKLEELRYALGGKAVIINSGYRSPSHNKRVGGASKSQHLYGKAADIKVRGVTPATVYNAADKLFNGVGRYNTFTHVDTRANKARF